MDLSTSSQLSVLMDLNKLSYTPPVDGSICNSRQLKKLLFNPSSYSAGQPMQIVVQSGSDFISGPTSYILADIKIFGTVAGIRGWNQFGTDGNGSAFNIFKEVQYLHRASEVLDRTDNINALIATLVEYAFDSSFAEKFAQMFGFGDNASYDSGTANGVSGITYPWAFPMFLVSGLWAQKALLPSYLVAGSRFQIQLETANTAIIAQNNEVDPVVADVNYSLENVTLVLDSIDIYDAAKRDLMTQAANVSTQGLQYPYWSFFNSFKSITNGNSINFDIQLSAAKTMLAIVKTRPQDAINNRLVNSMGSETYTYRNWRFRLGSLVMPQHEVDDRVEAYLIAQQAFNSYPDLDLVDNRTVQCGIGFRRYSDASGASNNGKAIIALTLEKTPLLNLSGQLTNNSQMLNFSTLYDAPADRQIDIWLKHLKCVNIMLDNVVVDK